MWTNGGRVAIHQGDMENLLKEFKTVRPSYLTSPPRLFNMVYNNFQRDLLGKKATKEELLKEYQSVFGGRVKV